MQAKHLRTGKTPNQNALSPSSSLRLKGLGQARGSLAQASSFCLGESSSQEIVAPAYSLLGETPLSWVRRSIAQN